MSPAVSLRIREDEHSRRHCFPPPTVMPSPRGESATSIAKRIIARAASAATAHAPSAGRLRTATFPADSQDGGLGRPAASLALRWRENAGRRISKLRTARPITQRASNSQSRCVLHSPTVDLLRLLSLMGIRGGFAVRRNAGSLIRREARGGWFREGCCLRCRYAGAQISGSTRTLPDCTSAKQSAPPNPQTTTETVCFSISTNVHVSNASVIAGRCVSKNALVSLSPIFPVRTSTSFHGRP